MIDLGDIRLRNKKWTQVQPDGDAIQFQYAWPNPAFDDRDWYPQGITGTSAKGRLFVLVSSYSKAINAPIGARIAAFGANSTGADRGRHAQILLVKEIAGGKYSAETQGSGSSTSLHAGGLASHRRQLLVTDTRSGVRRFDLSQLLEGADIEGKLFDAKDSSVSRRLEEFGCHYAVVRAQALDLASHVPSGVTARFSFCEIPRPEPTMLFTGSWTKWAGKPDDEPGVIHRWALSWAPGGNVSAKFDDWWTGHPGTQGVTASNDLVFLSRGRAGQDYLEAYRLKTDNQLSSRIGRWKVPNGPEDLHLSASGRIWGHTEFPGSRYIHYGKAPSP